MSHDPNIVVLGGRVSSIADITCETGLVPAGIAVRKNSSGVLITADNGSAPLIGVSMGPDFGDTSKTSVMKVGNYVPLLLQDELAEVTVGDITFTAKPSVEDGNDITVTFVDTLDDGSASIVVTDLAIIVAIESGVTDAETIKLAIEADPDADALVYVDIATGEEATPQTTLGANSLTGGSTFEPVVGAQVLIDDVSGMASATGDATAGVYLSGRLTGLYPYGATHPCALIAMVGGL